MIVAVILCAVVSFAFFKFRNWKAEKPIFGKYTQPSKWYYLKFAVFLVFSYLRMWFSKLFGKKLMDIPELDGPQKLSEHIKAFDAVFFLGANSDGYYFALGAERRQNNVINGLFYLATPDKGLLCSRKLPDTVLFNAKNNEFGAEGLSATPVQPMKQWKLSYDGEMWAKSDPNRVYSVQFSADWTTTTKPFNYDTDLHPVVVARAIARESWTREYFETLKTAHQSRYEQMGEAAVNVNIDGESHSFVTPSFRDHGYGKKRDWSLMHRYAFFHIFLENGMKAAIGVVSQPCTVSSMETGFVQEPDGTIYPVEWIRLRLHEHGECGKPPKDLGFQFKAGNVIYNAHVEVAHESPHYVGWDWEVKMVERFVKYTVNGIRGQGVSEFNYKHRGGRSFLMILDDPDWFKSLQQKYISESER